MTEKKPAYITMGKVPAWVERNLHVTVVRKTVYNWIIRGNDPSGRRHVPPNEKIKLEIARIRGRNYTTEQWIKEFFLRIN